MPIADEQERISVTLVLPRSVVETLILSTRRSVKDIATERDRLARIILRNRQRRQDRFPLVSFGEPSWDMILQLYVTDRAGQAIDVSGLCVGTGVPKTSALRHLDRLVESGLVHRFPDAVDGRRIFVRPSDDLRAQISRWLDAVGLALEVGPP